MKTSKPRATIKTDFTLKLEKPDPNKRARGTPDIPTLRAKIKELNKKNREVP